MMRSSYISCSAHASVVNAGHQQHFPNEHPLSKKSTKPRVKRAASTGQDDIETPQGSDYIVGYFDILGTADRIKNGSFASSELLDFAGAIASQARLYPESRIGVFSDGAMLAVPAEAPLDFLAIVEFASCNWLADHVLVRGGVAVGRMQWMDEQASDFFSGLPNLTMTRVFGPALVGAIELERSSGPGLLYFLSDEAAALFSRAHRRSVVMTPTPTLKWMDQLTCDRLGRVLDQWGGCNQAPALRRHLSATGRWLRLAFDGDGRGNGPDAVD